MIALMIDAARTRETSVNFYHTARKNNPDDVYLKYFYDFYTENNYTYEQTFKPTQTETCSTIPRIRECGMQGHLIQVVSL